MSLIEVMVGIVVAMLVSLAAIGSSQYVSGRQRAGQDIASAGANETNGLAALKYEVAHAGLGFFDDGHALCERLNLSQGTTKLASAEAVMPLAVTLAADGITATVDIVHGSALEGVSPAPLAAPTTAAAAGLAIGSYLPIASGDAVMLVPAAGSGSTCTVRTATTVVPSTDTTPLGVATAPSGSANQASFAPVSYGTSDFLVRLGDLQWSRFTVKDGNLVMSHRLTAADAVMARHVVAFTAQYGVAAAGGTAVGSWRKATGDWAVLDAAHLADVRALRVGLVVRSEQPEKRNAAGDCTASPQPPVLFGEPVALTGTDASCYRYRVGTIVVPLRNVVAGSGA